MLSNPPRPTSDAGDGKVFVGKVIVYKLADICTHSAVHLQPADLLLVALLAGGDYSVCLQTGNEWVLTGPCAERFKRLWDVNGDQLGSRRIR